MGTHFKGNKEELLSLNTWIRLLRASNSVFKKIKPTMVQYNLTVTQFAVLEALLHLGSLSQKAISQKLLRSSGNIVLVIDNLERDKLVLRRSDPNDRRVYNIVLTTKGERIIKKIFPDHIKIIIELFSTLNEDEQVELGRLCKKLGLGIKNSDN